MNRDLWIDHEKPFSFGNQGAAQAQNLRDTGIPNSQILIANRVDAYAEDAKSKGFNVEHDFGKAAKVADSTWHSPLISRSGGGAELWSLQYSFS